LPPPGGFARTFEMRLQPVAVLLFAVSGAFHLLLAAPRHARRKIEAIDGFDAADAGRVLEQSASPRAR
jgi:hypothetical protein